MSKEYPAESVQPYVFEDPARQETFMREVSEVVTFTANSGQRFSGLHVNRDFVDSGEPVEVRANSMFGAAKGVDQMYIAQQQAIAFPDRSFVIVDAPAHGSSDVLTPKQAEAIKKSSDLAPIGEAQLEGILNAPLLAETDEFIFTGEALGARLAIEHAAVASEKGLTPKHLIGIDTVGLVERNSAGLGLGYILKAPGSSKRYKQGEGNERLQQGFEDFKTELAKAGPIHVPNPRNEAGVLVRQRSLVRFLVNNSPLANDTGAERLGIALLHQPDMKVSMLFAGKSVVGMYNEDVQKTLDNVSRLMTAGNVDVTVWQNDDMGIGLAPNRPRIIAYEKDQLAA